MEKINYKVPGGKMLRVSVEIEDCIIKFFKITGDFFIHPEKAIIDIERFLKGKHIENISAELSSFVKKNKITLIGFSPNDLQLCLLAYCTK